MSHTKFLFCLFFCFLFFLPTYGQSPKFSRADVLEDLQYLRTSLEEAHFNLYAYTSREAFDATYLQVKNSISQDSLSQLQVVNAFQPLISAADNGHTEIEFPGEAYMAYAYAGGTLFPLELAFEEGKVFVRKNYSDNEALQPGTEILGLDGVGIEEVLADIYPHMSAERLYYKHAKIEAYSFPRLYWQVYGEQKEFAVDIQSQEGIVTHVLQAVDLIEGYETQREEVLNASMELRFIDAAALLNPGGFGGDQEKYERFIDSAFAVIKERNPSHLILDLRNNSGGNDAFSDYMVSYLADRPFQWTSRFMLKSSQLLKEHTRQYSDTTSPYSRTILERANGEVYEYAFEAYEPQPAEKRYTGKIYVLVNRQSHSQATVAAAQIQDYNWGTIVGEETGEFATLYASRFSYPLPNTGIPIKVSKGYMVRISGSEKAQGVVPDILIRDHLLDEEDEILTGVLERIRRGK